MRVAVVHSYYRSDIPSGENQIVDQQVAEFAARGLDVHLVARSSDALGRSAVDLARTAVDVARYRGPDPSGQLRRINPDVVHVHNLFPNFGAEWLPSWQGPLVATLHNFRTMCARAVLFRDGHVCTLCPDTASWAAVKHRCYRDSLTATVPMAWRTRGGARRDPLIRRADRLIVLSQPAHGVFAHYGVDPTKMRIVPNAVVAPAAATGAGAHPGTGYVFVGRLSQEKGLAELLRQWPVGTPLDILGSGPQAEELQAVAPAGVRFLGAVAHEEVVRRLGSYRAVIVPGVNPEGAYPLAVVEAWAADRPVVARAGGVAAAMVEASGAGAVYDGAAGLASALAAAHQVAPGTARAAYEADFTVDRWVDTLLAVYAEARDRRGPRLSG